MEERDEIITLVDEEGEKIDFLVLDHFNVEGFDYAILLPMEEESETGGEEGAPSEEDQEGESEAIIFRVEKGDNGESTLHVIDDEEEWHKVAKVAYERLLSEDEEGEEEAEE